MNFKYKFSASANLKPSVFGLDDENIYLVNLIDL